MYSKITNDSAMPSDLALVSIAFESKVGMFVTDASRVILKVNQAFTHITGYSAEEAVGNTPRILKSGLHDALFYEKLWGKINSAGFWRGEIWNRHKSGRIYPQSLTITEIKNPEGEVSHYVAVMQDITDRKQREQERLEKENAQRDTLVREVHHRIKNNLQGVTGLLRNLSLQKPEYTELMTPVISRVQSIAVIHGLQGRSGINQLRLIELISAIVSNNRALWQCSITLEAPDELSKLVLAESESVPIALILNELVINAIKHGEKGDCIHIAMTKTDKPVAVTVIIENKCKHQFSFDVGQKDAVGTGLELVSSLLPKQGASLKFDTKENLVSAVLSLEMPVVEHEDIGDKNG